MQCNRNPRPSIRRSRVRAPPALPVPPVAFHIHHAGDHPVPRDLGDAHDAIVAGERTSVSESVATNVRSAGRPGPKATTRNDTREECGRLSRTRGRRKGRWREHFEQGNRA